MNCYHCSVHIHPNFTNISNAQPNAWKDGHRRAWLVKAMYCPACNGAIILLIESYDSSDKKVHIGYPATATRPIPPEVQDAFRRDFAEACSVLDLSPKASAALSRRCLQMILKDKGGFTQKDLVEQIEAAIKSGKLPQPLSDAIDAVRHVGNFAAHPLTLKATGEIVEVEPGEAEWLLDTVEGLLNFYIVQPARIQAKRDALNAKLVAMGKPQLK